MWALLGCVDYPRDFPCPPPARPHPMSGPNSLVCADRQSLEGPTVGYRDGEVVAHQEYRGGSPYGPGWERWTDRDGVEYIVSRIYQRHEQGMFEIYTRRWDGAPILSRQVGPGKAGDEIWTWYDVDGQRVTAREQGALLEPDLGLRVELGEVLLGELVVLDVDPVNERAAFREILRLNKTGSAYVDCDYPGVEGAGGMVLGLWEAGRERRFEVYAPAEKREQCTSPADSRYRLAKAEAALAQAGLDPRGPLVPDTAVSLEVSWMDAAPVTSVEPTLFGCPCLVGRWQGKQGPALVYSDTPGEDPSVLRLDGVWTREGVSLAHWRVTVPGRHRVFSRHGFVQLRPAPLPTGTGR